MKYLYVLIFLALFLMSCSDTDEKDWEAQTENPLIGTWDHFYNDTDSLLMTRVFTYTYSYFTYADGREQNEMNKQTYWVMDNRIVMEKYTQEFDIKEDTLWITNSSGDQITKYMRKSFEWY